ncbi:MAG: hypothetical protein CMB99_04065 [Flavobacteriaceae bacterium]|nr:hypothetical protein [Flavobacteriaceae bacterium]|tara:strand:+ start:31555 stop:32310 length:756 start_codon:yes stop_codon:yes gene_type:complete
MKKPTNTNSILFLIFILILGFGIKFHFGSLSNQEKKYQQALKLQEALQDSLRSYRTESGVLISEKRSLQINLKELKGINEKLNTHQQQLVKNIQKLQKERKNEKEVFAAAQINYKKLIDSLHIQMASLKKNLHFESTNPNFQFDIEIVGVRPLENQTPKLNIQSLDFPNTQTITFNFDKNHRKDYPISFSVMNSNPYFKTNNIESYVIPGIQKEVVNPNAQQKFRNWFQRNGNRLLVGTLSFLGGVAIASF